MKALRTIAILALAVAAVGAASPPESENGYLKLGFDKLASFKFVTPSFDPVASPGVKAPDGAEQIPAEVKAWDGKKAIIRGFMLPTKLENGNATEFLIMASQMTCCYGVIPSMNEWVVVKMPQGTPVLQDVPLYIYGTLHVGGVFENGYLSGIYQMDAERRSSGE